MGFGILAMLAALGGGDTPALELHFGGVGEGVYRYDSVQNVFTVPLHQHEAAIGLPPAVVGFDGIVTEGEYGWLKWLLYARASQSINHVPRIDPISSRLSRNYSGAGWDQKLVIRFKHRPETFVTIGVCLTELTVNANVARDRLPDILEQQVDGEDGEIGPFPNLRRAEFGLDRNPRALRRSGDAVGFGRVFSASMGGPSGASGSLEGGIHDPRLASVNFDLPRGESGERNGSASGEGSRNRLNNIRYAPLIVSGLCALLGSALIIPLFVLGGWWWRERRHAAYAVMGVALCLYIGGLVAFVVSLFWLGGYLT